MLAQPDDTTCGPTCLQAVYRYWGKKAGLPEDIRGSGHVKARHLAQVRPRWDALMARWRGGEIPVAKAA